MLDLTALQTNQLLAHLRQSSLTTQLLEGLREHGLWREWERVERGAGEDLSSHPLRGAGREWMQAQLNHALAGSPLPVQWIGCQDSLLLLEGEVGPEAWPQRAPMICFRVGETLFWLDMDSLGWEWRPWLRELDPLLRLPYSHARDRELHQQADSLLRERAESLATARDLLYLTERRVRDTDVDGGWKWPDLEDIQAELARLTLRLGNEQHSWAASRMRVDLLTLQAGVDASMAREPVVSGLYEGALAEIQYPAGASVKRMVLASLADLDRQIIAQLHGWEGEHGALREERSAELRELILSG